MNLSLLMRLIILSVRCVSGIRLFVILSSVLKLLSMICSSCVSRMKSLSLFLRMIGLRFVSLMSSLIICDRCLLIKKICLRVFRVRLSVGDSGLSMLKSGLRRLVVFRWFRLLRFLMLSVRCMLKWCVMLRFLFGGLLILSDSLLRW